MAQWLVCFQFPLGLGSEKLIPQQNVAQVSMVLLVLGVWGGTWWMPCGSGPQGHLLILCHNLPRAFWHSSMPPSHGMVHLPSPQPWEESRSSPECRMALLHFHGDGW